MLTWALRLLSIMPSSYSYLLPAEVVDPHHHFLDTTKNPFQSFLRNAAGDIKYLPEDYTNDVIEPLARLGVEFRGSVHVEAMPDDGVQEAAWVEGMARGGRCDFVRAIVASCDLARDEDIVREELRKLVATTSKVRGVRWILDCVGKFDGKTATHLATSRHDGVDYLKEPKFERGLALLEEHNLSFDLQCAPVQLAESAASLFGRHPNLKVCIDHLGKPRMLLGDDRLPDGTANPNTTPDENELGEWRRGMRAMAALPNAYVKISMLGYAIPGWTRTRERKDVARSLARETVELFGAGRCMASWNWHVSGAVSDSDGLSDHAPDPVELLNLFAWFFEGYSREDTARLFAGTARDFYRLERD